MVELTIKSPQLTRRSLVISAITAGVAVVMVFAALSMRHPRPSASLSSIVGPISGFTPYFFPGQLPDRYTVNENRSLFVEHLLQITLDKPGKPSLVLTEQALPTQLSAQSLLTGGSQIKGAAGSATVNAIDSHVVGTLLPSAHATLVLITGPGNASPNDITDLLRALDPSP